MLKLAWVIPLVPFTSFWLILFFGKKAGAKVTSAVGIGAIAIAFMLSLVVGGQWIQRANSAEDGHIEPTQIYRNGDLEFECEGIVVAHDEGHEEASGGEADSEEIEAEIGQPVLSEAEAHHQESVTGIPVCDTVEFHDSGGTADSHDDADAGHDDESDEDEHSAPAAEASLVVFGQEDDEPPATDAEPVAEGADAEGEVAGEEEGHGNGTAGPVISQFTWFTWGDTQFAVGSMVDGLSVMMLFVVTLVSLLVHVYSTEYVKGDKRYTHFFAFLSLFTASMLMYVLAENILQMLIGWELVGVCSFVLIGHWWEEKDNSNAALKAFLTNRVGDMGLIIGVVILFFAVGGTTFSVLAINEQAATGQISHVVLLFASLALFAAVTSKSGQFPLHTWLPDAMAGPTPVSALIHAATMVVAGVYLVARLYPVFYSGLSIDTGSLNYVAVIGGVTTLVGGSLAFVQRDIKKVLAYSTVSQLGYMIMALGVGAWTAAVFHIFTHAFFKASLFLGAGSVSHAVHHSFDMKSDMGGLKKYMPQTFWTFAISSLALAGIFPLAGFWSKDEILAGAANGQLGDPYYFMLAMGLITALLTAAYMGRCIYLTFLGEYRGHGTPHESPARITVPLWILTGLAAVVGVLNLPADFAPDGMGHRFQTWVEPTTAFAPVVHADFMIPLAIVSIALAATGFGLAYLYYVKGLFNGLTEKSVILAKGYALLDNKYYLDHLYTNVIVGTIKGPIARAVNWSNQHIIDGVVNASAKVSVVSGRWIYKNIDQTVIDGAVNGSAMLSDEAGEGLRKVQTGRVQWYAGLLFGATTVFAALLVIFV